VANKKRIKLSDFAIQQGLTYITAYRHWQKNNIIGIQLPGGSILVEGWKDETSNAPEKESKDVIIYARASVGSKKDELKKRTELLTQYANKEGYKILEIVEEIGYSFSDKRMQLMTVLYREDWDVLLVSDKHEFMKFGLPYIETLLRKNGQEIVALNDYTITNEISEGDTMTGEQELANLFARTRSLMKTLIGVGGAKSVIDTAINNFLK
jgi:putative resolvase